MDRTHRVLLATATLLLTLTPACGGDSGDDDPAPIEIDLVQTSGRVSLPDGVVATRVLSAFAEAQVTDGAFTLDAPAGLRQLTIAVSADGAPLVMGWLGADDDVLSTRTTASVVAFLTLGGFHVPPQRHVSLMDQLARSPELDALAAALDSALAASPSGLTTPDPALEAALEGALLALLGPEGSGVTWPAGLPNALLVNPAEEGSGIQLNQQSGVNEITLTNRFRRRAFAFVDRVSIFSDGVETASPAETARVTVLPVEGLRDGFGTITQLILGANSPEELSQNENVAYVPRDSAPIPVPNVSSATKTRYRVAIVGPGDADGVLGTLSASEQAKQRRVALEFTIGDYIVPFISHIIAPAGWVLNSGVGESTTDALIDVLAEYPEFTESAVSGKITNAIGLVLGVGAFQAKLPEAILTRVVTTLSDKLYGAGANAAARTNAVALAKAFVQVLAGVNVTLKLVDAGFVEADMARSSKADVWTVDVIDALVRLDPADATMSPFGLETLTARVVDAGDDAVFEYRYRTPGKFGKLQSAIGSGTEITSSVEFITYVAESIGSEAVTVEVYEFRGSARVYVGDATAQMHVMGNGVVLDPGGDVEVDPFGEVALKATAVGDAVPDTLRFEWSADGALGTFDGETAVTAEVSGQDTHEVTFKAGFMPGAQVVTVRAFAPGEDEPYGEVRVDLTVRPFRVRITPNVVDVAARQMATLTATATPDPPTGTLRFVWTLIEEAGTIDGAMRVEHAVDEGVVDEVVFEAEADPSGDPIDCKRTVTLAMTYEGEDGSTHAPPTSTRVRVECPAEARILASRHTLSVGQSEGLRAEASGVVQPLALQYHWSVSGDASLSGDSGLGPAVTLVAGAQSGSATVTVEVRQGGEAIATASAYFQIDEDDAPVRYTAGSFDFHNMDDDDAFAQIWVARFYCPISPGFLTTGIYVYWGSDTESVNFFGPSGSTYQNPMWDYTVTGGRVFMFSIQQTVYFYDDGSGPATLGRFKAAVASRTYDCVGYPL